MTRRQQLATFSALAAVIAAVLLTQDVMWVPLLAVIFAGLVLVPTRSPKITCHEILGVGGMAEVALATYRDHGTEKQVAVKKLLPEHRASDELVALFRQEAALCAMMRHPNVVGFIDAGRIDDVDYLAMEYVDGLPLHWVAKDLDEPLPISAAAYVANEIAWALDYLHNLETPDGDPLGLVHRDLNPPNVLVSRDGDVKVADLGIAQTSSSRSGTPSDSAGKLHYLAPEQAEGADLDGRTDLFALGLILYELLTGRRLLHGKSFAEVVQTMYEPFAPPSAHNPDVPRELDELTMQLLELDPDARPASGVEVVARLAAMPGVRLTEGRQALAETVALAKEIAPVKGPRTCRRTRLISAA